jgi:hypothetical protein
MVMPIPRLMATMSLVIRVESVASTPKVTLPHTAASWTIVTAKPMMTQ